MSDHLLIQAMYLYKIILNNHARKHDCIVEYLNQHSILWGIQTQKSHIGLAHQHHEGICAGLAIEWIKCRARGIDFISVMLQVRNEVFTQGKTCGFSVKTQRLLNDVNYSHIHQNKLKNLFPRGLGKQSVLAYPFKGAHKVFSSGNYYYISTGTHAVAVHCEGEKIDLYDPNTGLIKRAPKKLVEEYSYECVTRVPLLMMANSSLNLKEKKLTITEVWL